MNRQAGKFAAHGATRRNALALSIGAIVAGIVVVGSASPAFAAACTTTCYVDAVNGSDAADGDTPATALRTIQAAIDAVSAGGSVRVLPGNYDETATNRTLTAGHGGGTYQFGLFFGAAKPDITVMGVTAADVAITDAASTLAHITTNALNNFGYSGIFVEADGITISGLEIGSNSPSNSKTIEVIGDDFTLTDSNFDVVANPYLGAVSLNDFSAAGDELVSYHITDNLFLDGTAIAISSGAGASAPLTATNREIIGNSFDQNGVLTYAAVSFNGKSDNTGGPGWYTKQVGGAVITGNSFVDGGQYIRARGQYVEAEFDWESYFNDNTFDHAAVALETVSPFEPRAYSYMSAPYTFVNVRLIEGSVQTAIGHATAGDTVLAGPHTFNENVTINKALTLLGSGVGSTTVQGTGTGAGITLSGAGTEDVTVTDLTVTGFQDGVASSGTGLADVAFTDFASVGNARHGIRLQNPSTSNLALNGVNASNNGTSGSGGRGIWVIDGAKTNITIANGTFSGNALVGIDISDGSLNGATIVDNTVNGNADSGIAVLGSIGPNPTLVSGNTVTDNHRFGIEIKNSTGSGLASGVGSLVVSANTVTRTGSVAAAPPGGSPPATEKDYAGIVVMRRSPILGNGNPDQPSGAVITGNTVSGFKRKAPPTQGDGFGIVVEGAGNVVTLNIVTDNNVGVQIQSANTANAYGTDAFDRGDGGTIGTPSSAVINRNSITGNTDDAMRNVGAALTDATCNWYGSAGGPSAGDVNGSFTVDPFLGSANLAGPCPAPTVPGPPVNVTAVPGDGQVALSWTAPASDGGSPITGFAISGGGTCTPVPATATTCVVVGLTNGVSVSLTVVAVNAAGTGPGAVSPAITPQGADPVIPPEPELPDYTPVGPKRVFDTRPGESPNALRTVPKQPIGGIVGLEIQITDLAGYVPATGVGAVSINVTATTATAAGFVTVDACGARRVVSSVNYAAGATVANAVIVPISPTGTICFSAQNLVDLVVDINGWFTAGRAFTGVGPDRVFDTRAGQSPDALRSVPKTQVGGADDILEVQLTNLPGAVPATGVGSVSLNVTIDNPADAGYLTVYPCGDREEVSSVNYGPGQTVANAVITPVSGSGTVCFYSQRDVDIVVDVNGWLKSPSGYTAVTPKRVFDTRPGESAAALRTVAKANVGRDVMLEVQFTDLAGAVPATDVGAVSLNVTSVNGEAPGFITVFTCGTRELVSSVNFAPGSTVANAVLSPLSATGTICFFASENTDIVVDVNGWFVEP